MESSMEAYTLTYVKQIANGNLLYDTGNSNWGSVTTERSGKGWEVGGRFKKEVQEAGDICTSMANSW